MSRRQEIEAKKQRLAELRRLREEKALSKPVDESNELGYETKKVNHVREFINTVDIVSDVPIPRNYKETSVQTEKEIVDERVRAKKISYSKGTQTLDLDELIEREQAQQGIEALKQGNPDADTDQEDEKEDADSRIDQTEVVIDEETLASFLQDSFKVLNRIIEDDKEIIETYTKNKRQAIESSKNHLLYHKLSFDSAPIYSIDSSPYTSDLLLISTGNTIYLYNLKYHSFETEYHSSTKIINVQFAKFDPNLIIGTGFNGKVSIWDLNQRQKFSSLKKLPMLESSVSTETHSYPVWALLQIHKDQKNDVLLTSSTDGKVISWDPQILAKPIADPVQLRIPKKLNLMYDELTPLSAIQISTGKSKTKKHNQSIVIGSEDGNIYKLNQNFEYINKIGSKSIDDELIDQIFQSHTGPVLDLDASSEFPHLFISCSMDWKVFLWDVSQPNEPLLTIYKSDSIMGCKWRPGNPTQIGYIYQDCFELLDLSINTVNPILTIEMEGGKTLNKMIFDREGKYIHLTDIDGNLCVYELLLDDVKSEVSKFKRKFANKSTSATDGEVVH